MNNLFIKRLQDKVALERDEYAYKLLFLHFYKPLARFVYDIVKTREASEEVVSDVMLKVWSLREGLGKIANLKVYLYKAAKNTALNYLYSNAKYRWGNIEDINESSVPGPVTPEDVMLKTEWGKETEIAIHELPPKCKTVYKLIRQDGFSYREVAATMGISENTVDRHLNNALHKLAKAMKIYFECDLP